MRIYFFSKTTLVVYLLFYSFFIYAQCPNGIKNCKGECPRFFDNNNDTYCDLTTITEIVTLQLKVNTDTTVKNGIKPDSNKVITKSKNKHNISIKEPLKVKNDAGKTTNNNISNEKLVNIPSNPQTDKTPNNNKDTQGKKPLSYDLILVSSITFGLYFFTFFLAKFKKIKIKTHRKLWNMLLLLTFIISCLFGFFLVLQINYNFLFSIFRTLLYWHVEIGIAMTLIAVFHILWHLKYFKTYFKAAKSSANE